MKVWDDAITEAQKVADTEGVEGSTTTSTDVKDATDALNVEMAKELTLKSLDELNSALAAWYPLTADAADATDHGNDGTATGVTFSRENGAEFNGTAKFTSYIDIPTEVFNQKDQMTISFWAYDDRDGKQSNVFGFSNGTTANKGWASGTSVENMKQFYINTNDPKGYMRVNMNNRGYHDPAGFIGSAEDVYKRQSSDTVLKAAFKQFFAKEAIQAAIYLPIEVNGHTEMYLSFCERSEKRNWSMDEIKFVNDVKRIIQSVLTKRIAQNSLASSYASLDAILENVGCGIYVWDPKENKILYANQSFHEFFPTEEKEEELMCILKGGCAYTEYYVPDSNRWFDVRSSKIQWVDGRTVVLYTIYEVTDKKLYQQKVERQANNCLLYTS